ncbi:hypothetical protein [Parasphingorhabdus sp.]|uniref:hypothetical protein n=1 Tax=Parasphingorhabdus sp. TaxID=2709688 RepID=UPI00359465A5
MDMSWLALLIPIAPFAIGGLWIWTRHQSSMIDKQRELMLLGERGPESSESRKMREEMKYLKERVAVLEQITTDGHSSRQLENKIEQLRDR